MAADTLNAVRGCGFHCRSLTPSQDLRFLLAVRESPVLGTPRRFAALLKFGSYRSEADAASIAERVRWLWLARKNGARAHV